MLHRPGDLGSDPQLPHNNWTRWCASVPSPPDGRWTQEDPWDSVACQSRGISELQVQTSKQISKKQNKTIKTKTSRSATEGRCDDVAQTLHPLRGHTRGGVDAICCVCRWHQLALPVQQLPLLTDHRSLSLGRNSFMAL